MRFYNRQHHHYCGIDLHVRMMYVCILDAAGQVLVHRFVKSTPAAFLEVVAPYHEDLVVAAECMFTWYWLADVCAGEGISFVLGHALAMKAIQGGSQERQARLVQDRHVTARRAPTAGVRVSRDHAIDGGSTATAALPRAESGASCSRTSGTRAPNISCPKFGRRLAYPANRTGVSEHFPDPSVRKSIDVDLALLERYDARITDLELTIVREANRHDGDAFHRLRSVPGIGKVLALTIDGTSEPAPPLTRPSFSG